MNSVIPVGVRLEWEFAVFVEDGLRDKAITGPGAALRCLYDDFRLQSGAPYRTAIADCRSAIRYRCDAEIARSSFIAAYTEYKVKLDRR